jgi:hypothetical protein
LFVFAFFTHAITPPFAARWSDTEPTFGSEIKIRASVSPLPFATVTVLAFAGFLNALRARFAVSPNREASSKRQGDGQRFQKKAMKTTNSIIEASAPANVRPSSVSNTSKTAQADFVRHCTNRRLATEAVLNYLRTRLPRQYEVAEVVGKWVWLDVSPARKPGLASLLWALGFHWNQRRGVWQHPCGSFNPFAIHPADPRAKYRSYFPADRQAA